MTAASSDAVLIRQARPSDGAAIGRVQSDSWRSTYAGLLPDKVLLRMTPARQARLWRHYLQGSEMGAVYVAEGPGGVIGFGSCGAAQTQMLPFAGEVYTLYVDDAMHGRGVGRRLLRTMFARLRREGRGSAVIWVLEGNPARFFYEAMGGVSVAVRQSRQWGADIAERAYGWRDLADAG